MGAAPWLTQFAGASDTAAAAFELLAAPGRLVLDDQHEPQPALAYNQTIPGPSLRLRLDEPAHIRLHNGLDRPTTAHWHGLRVPNAMDGVPGLTQDPVLPGGHFDYRFTPRDAGTFWYHPHFQSAQQLDRGLAGAIVVESEHEPWVDREVLWVLDDWRVDTHGQLTGEHTEPHDFTHAGRIGNRVTLNGRIPRDLTVRANERIRLRLLNVANARIFNLDFTGHRPVVIALDGHAVAPHTTASGRIVLAPSMRVDVILDCTGSKGRFEVRDVAYRRAAYVLTHLSYSGSAIRNKPLTQPVKAAPPVRATVPDLAAATEHTLRIEGGAMGRMRGALLRGAKRSMRELVSHGKAWAMNGIVAHEHAMTPMFQFPLGTSHVLNIHNDTAFPHPMHLHGHPLWVLNGVPGSAPLPHWRDTVLIAPATKVRVAVFADNPGLWMMHCHIPEHQEAGMMAIVEVS